LDAVVVNLENPWLFEVRFRGLGFTPLRGGSGHGGLFSQPARKAVAAPLRRKGLLDAAAAAYMFPQENSGFSIDASVRITLLDRDVLSYFRSLEHLLRYCARPPFALERLSVIRSPCPACGGDIHLQGAAGHPWMAAGRHPRRSAAQPANEPYRACGGIHQGGIF
jgi:hypothetical protein